MARCEKTGIDDYSCSHCLHGDRRRRRQHGRSSNIDAPLAGMEWDYDEARALVDDYETADLSFAAFARQRSWDIGSRTYQRSRSAIETALNKGLAGFLLHRDGVVA